MIYAVCALLVSGFSPLAAPSARDALAYRRAAAPLMADEHFDYLVIGGGSGGVSSARRAAAHGAKVGVIERDRLGGTCVNVGCVPKKVMFNACHVQEIIHQAAGFGFKIDGSAFDLAALKAKRDAYVARLNGIYASNLDKSGITSIKGDAAFVGEREVRVGDKTYSGEHVLIAVGGKPTMPDIPGIELAINSDRFFDLESVPKRVAVVGSGYIAVELAGILQTLGSQVRVCACVCVRACVRVACVRARGYVREFARERLTSVASRPSKPSQPPRLRGGVGRGGPSRTPPMRPILPILLPCPRSPLTSSPPPLPS